MTDADYNVAARIRYQTIPELEKKIEDYENNKQKERMLDEVVREEDVASVVSKWTQIPVSKLKSSESSKLLSLKDNLAKLNLRVGIVLIKL